MSKNIPKFQIQGPDGRVVGCPRSATVTVDGVTSIDPAKLKAGWVIYAPPVKAAAPVPAPAAQKGR